LWDFWHSIYLLTKLCIAIQNLSIGVNVVSKGSPSRIFKVLLISFGITILPRSSTRRTMPVAFIIFLSPLQTSRRGQCPHRPAGGHRPVAVPCVRLGDGAPALHTDRGHSLRSLHLPQAALPSLPYNHFTNYAVSICKGQEIIQAALNMLTNNFDIIQIIPIVPIIIDKMTILE